MRAYIVSALLKLIDMKIKVKDCFSGPDLLWNVGDVVDVDNETGKRLIKMDLAELVSNEPSNESGTKTYKGGKKKAKKKLKIFSDKKGKQKVKTTSIS